MPSKKTVFISHIHEEAALGAVIKDWVVDVFGGHNIAAFLSSDHRDIPAGRKWLDEVSRELEETGVMISLISPTSLARPWVNIELGAAWIKEVPIIPVCHGGQTIAALPRPFGDFNGVDLAGDDAPRLLMGGVADALKIVHPKGLHWAEILKQMRGASGPLQVVANHPAHENPVVAELPPDQIAILQALALEKNRGSPTVEADDIAKICGVKPAAILFHSEKLNEAGLINIRLRPLSTLYRITGKGAGWLIQRGMMPDELLE